MTNTLEAYLQDFGGVVSLLQAAQEANGEKLEILGLAAEALRTARQAHGFHIDSVNPMLADFETQTLAEGLILPQTYLELVTVYNTRRLQVIRRALSQLGNGGIHG